MRVLFATSNQNKIAEAKTSLGLLGYTVEQLLIDGTPPDFIEPQTDEIEIISKSKIQQSLEFISGTELEG